MPAECINNLINYNKILIENFPKNPGTYRNVHQMLKHIVLSQKNAAKKRKCIRTAKTEQKKNKVHYYD